MEKLILKSRKEIKIEVNDAGEYITINLGDADFPKRFMSLYKNIEKKMLEVAQKGTEKMKLEDELKYYSNVHKELADDIDALFGAGTCKKVFGDIVPDTNLITEFFSQIMPILKKKGMEFSAKYNPKRKGSRR